MNRRTQFQKINTITQYDICIIGGGATGAGIALDASLRGINVLLIDKYDFAAQTSSKSTKLIHGGVRYLEQAFKTGDIEQFKMVKKSLHERDILINNAPHLTRKLPLLTPCYSWIQGIYLTIGLKLYERIAGKSAIGKSRWLFKKQALNSIPELNSRKLKGAVLYYDGQLDDARYCLAIIQKAEEQGATAINYAEAVRFIKNEQSKKLESLVFIDRITNSSHTINARVFINATGPFADNIRHMANASLAPRMKVSRGAHIVLPSHIMKGDAAMLIPKTSDGRVLFIIPWQDALLVGTTDEHDNLSEAPKLEEHEIPYLIGYVNKYLNKTITPDQIKGSFAGQRPLLGKSHSSADTKSLIRDHEIEVDNTSNLVSVMGGKWTTYRLMAQDTIEHIYKHLWKETPTPCSTQHTLLYGAEEYNPNEWDELCNEFEIGAFSAKHLLKKYGSKARHVLEATNTNTSLKELLVLGHPFIKAEVIYVIENEMAINSNDILERRLGLSLRDEEAADKIVGWVEEQLALYASHQHAAI